MKNISPQQTAIASLYKMARDSLLAIKDRKETLSLVASESLPSRGTIAFASATLRARNSAFGLPSTELTEHYLPGMPNEFYVGIELGDHILQNVMDMTKEVFGVAYANPLLPNGSLAIDLIKDSFPNRTIISAEFPHGHFTQGEHDKQRKVVQFSFNHDGTINYNQLANIAKSNPKSLMFIGGSVMPKLHDWKRLRKIADETGAVLVADFAPIAGLVAAKKLPNPMKHAHIGTFTTHKTFGSVRGAVVLCQKEKHARKINKAFMPARMGEKPNDVVSAIGYTLWKILNSPKYIEYAANTLDNAQKMCTVFQSMGFKLFSGGTQTHQVIIQLEDGVDGVKLAEDLYSKIGIRANHMVLAKNTDGTPKTYGIRMGTQAMTSYKVPERIFEEVASNIGSFIKQHENLQYMHARNTPDTLPFTKLANEAKIKKVTDGWKKLKAKTLQIAKAFPSPNYGDSEKIIAAFVNALEFELGITNKELIKELNAKLRKTAGITEPLTVVASILSNETPHPSHAQPRQGRRIG